MTVTIRTYAEIVPPVEPEREVVLHMTMEQAGILHALTGGTFVDGVGSTAYPLYRALSCLPNLPKYTRQEAFHITKEK